jgi:hypothetical protein
MEQNWTSKKLLPKTRFWCNILPFFVLRAARKPEQSRYDKPEKSNLTSRLGNSQRSFYPAYREEVLERVSRMGFASSQVLTREVVRLLSFSREEAAEGVDG